MKKLFILFALMLCAASFAMAQKTTMGKETTEQALIRMEKEVADGLVKGDLKAFNMYVSDHAILIDPSGVKYGKADAVADFAKGEVKFTESTLSDFSVTMFGENTAVISFVSDDKLNYKGAMMSGKSRWADTFMKMDGKWWCIATAGAPIQGMK